MADYKCILLLVLICFTVSTECVSLRRKIARYQRFRSSGTRDAHGYVLLEQPKFDKILNTTRSILPSLQNNVDKWNADSEGLFEAINPLALILLDGFKAKFIRTEKKYSDLFYAFYPEVNNARDKNQVGNDNKT